MSPEDKILKWIFRCFGGAMMVCLVLVSIFGERSKHQNTILVVSLIGGAAIAVWLTKAEKKREFALQTSKDVVK